MFIEELVKDIIRLPHFENIDGAIDGLIIKGEAKEEETQDARRRLKSLIDYRDHFMSVLDKSQHYVHTTLKPILPKLTDKGKLPFNKFSEKLSNIDAKLPSKYMTISYRRNYDKNLTPCIAQIEELSEGLIDIRLWVKKEYMVTKWSNVEFSIIISTKGDFAYWDGLKEYFNKINYVDDKIEEVNGFVYPFLRINGNVKQNICPIIERQMLSFEADLFNCIIPYIYLLNVKRIPMGEYVLAPSSNNEDDMYPIIYKKIDVTLPLYEGHIKEYLPDKPLFGKYSGFVWCPPHVKRKSKKKSKKK